jgi:hypothetical protein
MFSRTFYALAAASVMPLVGPRPLFVRTAYAAEPTPIEEVVMYGIDADTYELLRYTFNTDEYVRIGKVVDESGNVVVDVEALAYIPSGPHKGFYGGANYYEEKPCRIVKINAMDATAETLPAKVGYEKVEGLVPVQNPITGKWRLLASTQHSDPDDGDHALLWIDPATGAGSLIRNTNENYDGLAMGADGTVWGITEDQLYTIDVSSGNENSTSTHHDFGKTEALEWAFGDFAARIDVPGVPADWTKDGILFGFSDDDDALLILDPKSGEAVKYACSFQTIDCEGLVFTTLARDAYGEVVVEVCD